MSDAIQVLVYSDDASTRAEIRLAVGRKPAADLPMIEFIECATQPAALELLDEAAKTGAVDLVIVDAEARPGGLGLCRQLKDEIYECPPVLAIIARRDDGWLATWSRADGVVGRPVDPIAVAGAVTDLIRQRIASRLPVR
jgi:DNA-binding NarL/FixJ family response regulator